MTQPALSRQVRLLEVELRQTLLVRNGRGATPTEAGKLLLEHARGILHQVARAREALGMARGALDGRVSVGFPPTLARALTVPLSRAFRSQLPNASLSVSEGLSVAMQDGLASGRLDIALLYDAQPTVGIDAVPLADEALMWIEKRPKLASKRALTVKPGAPIPLIGIVGIGLVIPSRPNAIRMRVEAEFAALGLRPTVALEIDGIGAILDLVADGAGSAILPRQAVSLSTRPTAYRVRPILRDGGREALSVRVSVATSSTRPMTLTQTATLALIRELTMALHRPG